MTGSITLLIAFLIKFIVCNLVRNPISVERVPIRFSDRSLTFTTNLDLGSHSIPGHSPVVCCLFCFLLLEDLFIKEYDD